MTHAGSRNEIQWLEVKAASCRGVAGLARRRNGVAACWHAQWDLAARSRGPKSMMIPQCCPRFSGAAGVGSLPPSPLPRGPCSLWGLWGPRGATGTRGDRPQARGGSLTGRSAEMIPSISSGIKAPGRAKRLTSLGNILQ